MCLDKLVNVEPVTFGYKVFKREDKEYVYPIHGKPQKKEQWISVEKGLYEKVFGDKYLTCENGQKYLSGFHVFHELMYADLFSDFMWELSLKYHHAINETCIKKVHIRNPICVGYQHGLVTVAKSIYIEPTSFRYDGFKYMEYLSNNNKDDINNNKYNI